MGKVEKYCNLLLQARARKINGAFNGGDLFLNGYLQGSTSPADHETGVNAGDIAETAINQNELTVIFSFEPHPVTFL
jgi:hypothetical protein